MTGPRVILADDHPIFRDARIEQTKAKHSEFSGKTFAFAGGLADASAQIAFYVSTDPRVQLVQDLGLVLADGIKALPIDQGFNIPISVENLDSVDADIFIAWHPDQAGADYVRSNDLVSRYRPVAEGHFIPITDRSFVMATSAPSPLSIPYALETLVPEIAAVLK